MWYFGYNAGLNFNSGSPVSVNNSQITTTEGCSSIADANGNLVMYTDGITIWDRTHTPMPNGIGLLGDPSSAQSGIIVPKPGNLNIYYVFTVAVEGSASGICYSEVNMTLNGGNGDVTANKNIFLIGPSSEKLTAVKHANGQDIWVVTQTDGTNDFYAFLVSPSGINMTPVTSSAGTANAASSGHDGYLKFSPDGKKLSNALLDVYKLNLYDFDPSTGIISNAMVIDFGAGSPYGTEFSPDNKVLYVATESTYEIFQFDLSNWNVASIVASKTNIFTNTSGGYVHALQLALDGKIYVATIGPPSAGVINSPNTLGSGCNYNNAGVTLTTGTCAIGLPQFITSYFLSSDFTFNGTCYGDTTFFTSQLSQAPDSVLWDFGIAGTNLDSSKALNPYYIYPDTGDYTVTLYSWLNGVSDTAIETVHIYGKFLIPILDQPICSNGSTYIVATHSGASYVWNDGSTNDSLLVNNPGTYWVQITQNGCMLSDTAKAILVVFPFSLGNDTTLCPNTTLTKTLNVPTASYVWSNTSSSNYITISEPGTYWVDVEVQGCVDRDDIVISYYPNPLFIGDDVILCFDTASITLVSNMNSSAYLWNTGATTPSIIARPDSLFILQIVDQNQCVLSDSIFVSHNTPHVYLGEDVEACLGDNFVLNVEKPEFIDYKWNTGQDKPLISVSKTGTYLVLVKDTNNCYASDTISYDFDGCSLFIPNAFTPDENRLNDQFNALGENITNYSLQIFNRWGNLCFETNSLNIGWDGKENGSAAPQGVYSYILKYRGKIKGKEVKKYGQLTLVR